MYGKIIIVGPAGVGKSSLMRCFAGEAFIFNCDGTNGIDCRDIKVTLQNAEQNAYELNVRIIDTPGQERFREMTSSYYQGASAAIIVYDITRRETFAAIPEWLQITRGFLANDDIPICLVACKNDLTAARVVTTSEGEQYANQNGLVPYEVSARTGDNVDTLLNNIVKHVHHSTKQRTATNSSGDFEIFKRAYLRGTHPLACKTSRGMYTKLIKQEFRGDDEAKMAQVIDYIKQNHDSRSARVFYNNFKDTRFKSTNQLTPFDKFQIAYFADYRRHRFTSRFGMFRKLKRKRVNTIEEVQRLSQLGHGRTARVMRQCP